MKTYDLNLLTALDALLATGSVTSAATRMHLSTPAMSHTLARIREAFGDPILVRSGRALVPTARALALAEPVRLLLAQAQALRAADGHRLETSERRFIVRAPEGWAVVYGAALSQAIESRMPLASLQFLPEAHHDPAALRDGRIDLDIGSFRDAAPQAHALVLSQQALLGAARSEHPLLAGGRRPARAAALRGMPLARYVSGRHVDVAPRTGTLSPIDQALAETGAERRVALLVPSTFTALIAASRTDLIATAPERTARAMAPPLGLTLFKLPVSVQTEPTRMTWHARHDSDPAHQWLRECMQTVFQGGYSLTSAANAVPATTPRIDAVLSHKAGPREKAAGDARESPLPRAASRAAPRDRKSP